MKQYSKVGIIFSMLIFGFAAIGSGSTEVDKEISSMEGTADDGASKTGKDAGETSTTASVEETVLVDEKDIKITAVGLEDGFMGTELKLLIENNSSTNLTVQARNSSVNGFMVDTMMSADVAAGKKANDSLTFSTSGLKDCGIDTMANMEFNFHIFTTEGWDDYLDTDVISLDTSVAGSYVQSYDDSGEVFYNQNGIKIIGKGLSTEGSFWGPGLIVYIENTSSQNITVQVRDVSINGFMVDPIMSQEVVTGKKAITAVTFFSSNLEENGIEEIEEIETSFHIFDTNSWDTIVDTEPVKITF